MKKIFLIVLVLAILSTAFQASGAAKFKNADPERKERELLQLYAEGSDEEIIRALKAGANPNAGNGIALTYAAEKHGANVIKALFEAGIKFNPHDGKRVISLAAKHNPDPEALTVLIIATVSGLYDSSFIKRDIFEHIDQDTKEYIFDYINQNKSFLCLAARENNHHVVERLLALGANVNPQYMSRPHHSEIPLICAARNKKYPKVIEILIEAGAEDRIDVIGKTALMYAVEEHNNAAVKTLVEAGTEVNYVRDNSTALTEAVRNCNVEALKILINAGADVNKGKIGRDSPLQYAKDMFERTNKIKKSGQLEQAKKDLAQLEKMVKQATNLGHMERELLLGRLDMAKAAYDNALLQLSQNEGFAECIKLLTRAGAK